MKCRFDGCERGSKCKGYCDMHYRRLLKRGSVYNYGARKVELGDDIERFHKKYVVEQNGCWIWQSGSRGRAETRQYGRHWANGKSINAHRFSYLIHIGQIPDGIYVCHKCDNPLCVNPNHLFLGTHQDNMKDMTQKNRAYKGRGEEKHWLSKLTNNQANEIRNSDLSQSKLAKIYGVSQTTIGRIKRGVSY